MTTVAVTGISGYLGTGLLSALQMRDEVETIAGIDLRQPGSTSPKLKYIQCDVTRPFGEVLKENGVDCAIHLAFQVRPTHNYAAARRLDIDGAQNFIDACREAQVKRMLYLSSYTAYGPHEDNPFYITEDMPLRPVMGFAYSRHKAEADLMFQEFAEKNPAFCVTIVRGADILGPRGGGSIAAARYPFVMLRLAGYNPRLQYLHEDDLAEILTFLILEDHPGVFNAGADGTVTYKDAIALSGKPSIVMPSWLISPLVRMSWALRLQSQSPPPGLEFIKYSAIMSNDRIKKEGYTFRYDTRETLDAFLAAQK